LFRLRWTRFLFFFLLINPLWAGERPLGFDSGMETDTRYSKYSSRYSKEWGDLKNLYNAYQKIKPSKKGSYRIPKKIHMIWLGSDPPKFVWTMFDSWKRNHSGWEVKLWTQKEVDSFQLKNLEAYQKAKNWGEKSDIFRYELLEREGGIYVDADFECLQPFDDICKRADFFTGVAYSEGPPHFYNGLIGCRPGHPIMRRCVSDIRVGPGDNDFQRILHATGPHYFSACIRSCMAEDVGVFAPMPVTFFYPFPDTRRDFYSDINVVKRDWVHPWSYAIHYWKLSWAP
jgi:inositol phosphorylceramide mannosyltransferase catalytic subunit